MKNEIFHQMLLPIKMYGGQNFLLFRAGRHFEWPVETGHEDLELADVLLFVLEHAEHQTAADVKRRK